MGLAADRIGETISRILNDLLVDGAPTLPTISTSTGSYCEVHLLWCIVGPGPGPQAEGGRQRGCGGSATASFSFVLPAEIS